MCKCSWAIQYPINEYHDNEYGVLPQTERDLFEALVLEIFQPGLSFNIVLKKRDGLREFFKEYDIKKIATMTDRDVERGLDNPNIIRHRLKISAVIANAKLLVDNNINLLHYIFNWIDYRHGYSKVGELFAKKMKNDGFKFIGVSVGTSFLQAIGLLNNHESDCINKPLMDNNFSYQLPFGCITISYNNFSIESSFINDNSVCSPYEPLNSFEQYLIYHLNMYINKQKSTFKGQLKINGTPFQKQVFDVVANVPFGTTQTYSDVAYTIGSGAFRAVGSTLKNNNFALFIPAHRIVGKNNIGGFQNQIDLKKKMLNYENIIV